MQDTRPRASNQLPLTRNQLYALGVVSLSMAFLAFFVGYQVGRGKVVAPPPPPVAKLVPDEVAQGDLEVLLAGVEHATAGSAPMGFPAELPRAEEKVEPPVLVDGAVPGEAPAPVEPPPPPPNPFPSEARPGTAALSGAAGAVPAPSADIPTSGWAIQVGEVNAEADADRYVETLRAAELSAYKVVALVDGAWIWRVRVGGYSSKETAAANLAGVASKAGAAEATVIRAP